MLVHGGAEPSAARWHEGVDIALSGCRPKVTATAHPHHLGPRALRYHFAAWVIYVLRTLQQSTQSSPSIHPNIITLSRAVSLVPVPLRLQSMLREERNGQTQARGHHRKSTASLIVHHLSNSWWSLRRIRRGACGCSCSKLYNSQTDQQDKTGE